MEAPGFQVTRFKGHTNSISSCAFLTDSSGKIKPTTVATVGEDRRALLFDLRLPNPVYSLSHPDIDLESISNILSDGINQRCLFASGPTLFQMDLRRGSIDPLTPLTKGAGVTFLAFAGQVDSIAFCDEE